MDGAVRAGGCACQREDALLTERADPQTSRANLRAAVADDRGGVGRRVLLAGTFGALTTLAVGACAAPDQTAGPGESPPKPVPTRSQTEPAVDPGSDSAAPPRSDPGSASDSASESASESSPAPDGGSGEAVAGTGDFPVGGGVVVTTDSGVVVVTHPTDTEFRAFSGRCPHAGCPVTEVTENTIVCMCHGSTFDGTTGDRLEGPARTGLQPVAIAVEGDLIYLT